MGNLPRVLPGSLPSNLKKLTLECDKIDNIQGLESLINLETLIIDSKTRINTIGLGCLKNLQKLYLNDNKITIIQGLDGLINLKHLEIHTNKIIQISETSLIFKGEVSKPNFTLLGNINISLNN